MAYDLVAIATAYLQAVGEKQLDRLAPLLHPELDFSMPGRSIHGADGYLAALRRLGPILLRNEVKKTFVDGDDVCVIYDFVTDTSVGAVPSVEWLTFEGGRIRAARLIFHSQPWPAVLEELQRRSAAAMTNRPGAVVSP
jgi:SnoaL-like domain